MFFIAFLVLAAIAFVVSQFLKKRNMRNETKVVRGVGVVFVLVALSQMFTSIPAGTVGVVDLFGVVSDNTLKPGINLVNPFADVIKFTIKKQELKEVMTVPSQEGLNVQLEVSLLFSINENQANIIYKTIGKNYMDIILIPQFRSVVRGVTSKYDAKALYTDSREKLADDIQKELQRLVKDDGIIIISAPMRQIILPGRLTAAIEEKLQAEQESQRMQFILKKEEQEAERKRIEAKGISDFQNIVSRGISAQLLKWKGIEATEKLAASTNAKVIVIGSGKDGLPLILGNN